MILFNYFSKDGKDITIKIADESNPSQVFDTFTEFLDEIPFDGDVVSIKYEKLNNEKDTSTKTENFERLSKQQLIEKLKRDYEESTKRKEENK